VFLANPGNHKVFEPDLHVDRSAGRAEGYLVIAKQKDDYGNTEVLALPPQWDVKGTEEENYRDAEYTRLLYVAATRAKNILVVSTYGGSPEKSPWHPLEHSFDRHNCREAFSVLKPAGSAAGVSSPAEPGPIDSGAMQGAAESIREGLESIAEPSYEHVSGTALHSGEDLPERQEKGRGTAWGTAVHVALELLVRKSIVKGDSGAVSGDSRVDAQQVASEVALEVELTGAQKEELNKTLEGIITSDFWQRVATAQKVMSEVPFGTWEGDTYSTGVVDLAFRENGGWVLVDYKSDSIENDNHRQKLIEYYRPQLELYRKSWEEITGEKVVECALFFTDQLYYGEL